MLAILLGVLIFSIGFRAFTKAGLPLAPGLQLKGVGAKILGLCCCLIGCAIVGFVFYANLTMAQEATQLIEDLQNR